MPTPWGDFTFAPESAVSEKEAEAKGIAPKGKQEIDRATKVSVLAQLLPNYAGTILLLLLQQPTRNMPVTLFEKEMRSCRPEVLVDWNGPFRFAIAWLQYFQLVRFPNRWTIEVTDEGKEVCDMRFGPGATPPERKPGA